MLDILLMKYKSIYFNTLLDIYILRLTQRLSYLR